MLSEFLIGANATVDTVGAAENNQLVLELHCGVVPINMNAMNAEEKEEWKQFVGELCEEFGEIIQERIDILTAPPEDELPEDELPEDDLPEEMEIDGAMVRG